MLWVLVPLTAAAPQRRPRDWKQRVVRGTLQSHGQMYRATSVWAPEVGLVSLADLSGGDLVVASGVPTAYP